MQPLPPWPRGFGCLIGAQGTSALADHALLIVAIAWLAQQGEPLWWAPLLKLCFTLAYVLLAPVVGALADAVPKGRWMMAMNALKLVGVFMMLADVHAALAMAVVGLGAAAYAPAKYGLVTQTVPPRALVAANGWLEVTTVCAALFGTALGGLLIAAGTQARFDAWQPGADPLAMALIVLVAVYASSALLNLGVHDGGVATPHAWRGPRVLICRFVIAQRCLWRDGDGALSMAVTTLFWGAAAVLQVGVLQWAQAALGLPLSVAAVLPAAVAAGVIAGAAAAGRWVTLAQARSMLPLGVLLGLLVALVAWTRDWRVAVAALVLIGAAGGALVVPLNALLQHRGHVLLSAGRSIAVQNFNENASILVMLGVYAALLAAGVTLPALLSMFGALVALVMLLLVLKTARATPRAPTLTMGQAGIAPGAFAMPGGQYGGPKDDDDQRPGHGAARQPRPARPEGRRQDGFHDAQ